MSDGAGGGDSAAAAALAAAAGAAAGGGAGDEGGAGGGGDQGGGKSWRDVHLSEELRGNDVLARYNDVEGLAKALIETKNWARDRVAVPKDDASFAEFAAKMRPENAEGYVFENADGLDMARIDRMRSKFLEAGLHPRQASMLVNAFAQDERDQLSAFKQANADGLSDYEAEIGSSGYNQRLEAIGNMLSAMEIGVDDLVPALEMLPGSNARKAIEALARMAEMTGELAKVDGKTAELRAGKMTAADADAEITRMDSDPETVKHYNDPNSPQSRKRKQLMARVAQGDKKPA